MTYNYSGFIIEEEDDDFLGYPRKKSIGSTEYSYKNMLHQQDSIDQYLVLDNSQNGGSTGEPHSGVPQRKRPLPTPQAIRLRNKLNAKKSRQRKKCQFDTVSYRLKELQLENDRLRQQKSFCSRCKTKLSHESYSNIDPKQDELKEERRIDIEFEKPEFKPDRDRAGKIWIAIGLIMLILGMNIHGVSHKEPIEIRLKRSAIDSLKQQMLGGDDNLKLPMSFRNPIQEKGELEKPDKQSRLLEVSLLGLRITSMEDKTIRQDKPSDEEHFEVSRDFLSQLQGEINDIGRYI